MTITRSLRGVGSIVVAFFVWTSLTSADAHARIKIESVYVFSEDPEQDDSKCNISKRSTVAAVEGVFRRNGIPIVSHNKSFGSFNVYLSIAAIQIPGGCAISYGIQARLFGSTVYGPERKTIYGQLEVCGRNGIMGGPTHNLLNRLNTSFLHLAQECISEMEKADE